MSDEESSHNLLARLKSTEAELTKLRERLDWLKSFYVDMNKVWSRDLAGANRGVTRLQKKLKEQVQITARIASERACEEIRARKAETERDELLRCMSEWNNDAPQPEDKAIQEAFPTRTGRHDLYFSAMRLVNGRYSKDALVALVNWLLVEIENGRKANEAQP